jgi:heme/copper-type cytochrome/quinol oxidase subunit 3
MNINNIYTHISIKLATFHRGRKGVNGTHIYHILNPSKWPVLMSLVLFCLAVSFVIYMNKSTSSIFSNLSLICICFITTLYFWSHDLLNESGEHTSTVRRGLKMGMVLFIMSECMFFFAFFWAYLHSSTNPSIEIGHVWPPVGQAELLINSTSLPFLNTLLLLTSGAVITFVHKISIMFFQIEEALINLKFKQIYKTFQHSTKVKLNMLLHTIFSLNYIRHFTRLFINSGLVITIVLASIFSIIQYNEYVDASLNIADGIYASCFYLMTGFHGVHVIVGTILIIIAFIQLSQAQSYYKALTGLECAIWYWHFVDVVWLFLYVLVYLITDEAYQHEAPFTLVARLQRLEPFFDQFSYGCTADDVIGFAVKNQKYFNIPASTAMNEIVWLHDFIMFFIIIIFFIILAIFYGILKRYTTIFIFESYVKHVEVVEENKSTIFSREFEEDFDISTKVPNTVDEPIFRSKTY